MRRLHLIGTALIALVVLQACKDSTGPSNRSFSLSDPSGDTLSAPSLTLPRAHDVLAMVGVVSTDSVFITVTFAQPVTASGSTQPFGFIEMDTDENSATGVAPYSNNFGASANIGIDYDITLTSGYAVVASTTGSQSVNVPLIFSGNSATVRFAKSAIGGDDGRMRIVGVVGTYDRPTDVFPNAGFYQAIATSRAPAPGVTSSLIGTGASDLWSSRLHNR